MSPSHWPNLYHHSPAGWDSDKKINILSEHMKTIDPDAPFDKVIQPPASANVSDYMACHTYALTLGCLSLMTGVMLWVVADDRCHPAVGCLSHWIYIDILALGHFMPPNLLH